MHRFFKISICSSKINQSLTFFPSTSLTRAQKFLNTFTPISEAFSLPFVKQICFHQLKKATVVFCFFYYFTSLTHPPTETNRNSPKSGKKFNRDLISLPQNDFRHVGHVGADGTMFGDVGFSLDNVDENERGKFAYSCIFWVVNLESEIYLTGLTS